MFSLSLKQASQWSTVALLLILTGCASVPERQPLPPEYTLKADPGYSGGTILGGLIPGTVYRPLTAYFAPGIGILSPEFGEESLTEYSV